MADDTPRRDEANKRGPKGGRKHKKPGRDHDRKSSGPKKRRWRRRIAARKKQRDEEARRQWAMWDSLSDEQQKLLGEKGKPTLPRAQDDG